MNLPTKATLLSLTKAKEPDKLIFCLQSVAKEEADGDFFEVFEAILHSLAKIKLKDLAPSDPDLRML